MNTKNRTRKILITLSVALFLALTCAALSYAGIMVEPTVIETSGRPGDVLTGEYKVINKSDEPVIVSIEPVDWMREYLKKERTRDPKEWLSFEETSFELAPAELKKIAYTVTVPKDLKEEQAAQVYFAFMSKDGGQAMRTRLGVIFYLGVSNKVKVKADIEDFFFEAVPSKDVQNAYDVNFRITIENKGNVHIRPFGNVTIKQKKTELVVLKINPERGIYAGDTDAIKAYVEEVPLTPGKYTVIAEMHCDMYGKEKLIKKKKKLTFE